MHQVLSRIARTYCKRQAGFKGSLQTPESDEHLTDVARNNFGFVAYMTLYCFTGWKADSSRDFVFSKCYKVVSSDPQDTLINDLASLKTGIAVKLLET